MLQHYRYKFVILNDINIKLLRWYCRRRKCLVGLNHLILLPFKIHILVSTLSTLQSLQEAESKAAALFQLIEDTNLIAEGSTEKEINTAIFELAQVEFGIEKYWHKRIVRAGKNTLHPYDENPEDLVVQNDDIIFIDFGPILEDWEADYGRTYVLGNDPAKIKLTQDVEKAWYECRDFYLKQPAITGAQFYEHVSGVAQNYGWEFGGEIAGHLIGHFPHEKLDGEDKRNYVHPENHVNMRDLDQEGNPRHWILEIHFIDRSQEIGGFFEQVLC